MSQSKHAEARELMYSGALLFFSHGQVSSAVTGRDLGGVPCQAVLRSGHQWHRILVSMAVAGALGLALYACQLPVNLLHCSLARQYPELYVAGRHVQSMQPPVLPGLFC